MSNYWHCETCDSRNHDDRQECWKCFPQADELREEIETLTNDSMELERKYCVAMRYLEKIYGTNGQEFDGVCVCLTEDLEAVLKETEPDLLHTGPEPSAKEDK